MMIRPGDSAPSGGHAGHRAGVLAGKTCCTTDSGEAFSDADADQ